VNSDRYLKEGVGWRLGWNPDASVFKGLVGGRDWALEMTAPEFQDFCRLAVQLSCGLGTMAAELMDEERIACEQETPLLWIEVEGYPTAYGLRFILLTGRQGEGAWPPDCVPHLLEAIATLGLF
jgi:hypothetical protein